MMNPKSLERANHRLFKYLLAVLKEEGGSVRISAETQGMLDALSLEGLEKLNIRYLPHSDGEATLSLDMEMGLFKVTSDPEQQSPRAFYHAEENVRIGELDGVIPAEPKPRVYDDDEENWITGGELLDEYIAEKDKLYERYVEKFLLAAKREGGNRRMAQHALHSVEREVVRGEDLARGYSLECLNEAQRMLDEEIHKLNLIIMDEKLEGDAK